MSNSINQNTLLKLVKQDSNPYAEGSQSWNIYVDLCVCERGGFAKVSDLMTYNSLSLKYYAEGLGQLILDSVIEVSHE